MSDRARTLPSTPMLISIPHIHLILIPLPIASLLAALVTDVVYWATREPLWALVGLWLVAAGLVTGPTAGVVGLIDFMSVEPARPALGGWVHIIGMGALLLVTLLSFMLRSADPAGAILPWGLTLSIISTMLMMVGAWYGGVLAFRRRMQPARADGGE